MKSASTIKPLAYQVYLYPVVVITLVGLADSIYLAISHYRVYSDIGYKSFCAISRAINCDTVSQSPYAIMLDVPVAIWGVIGYIFILILLITAATPSAPEVRIWSLIFWVMLLYGTFSVILALISSYRIRSYCILCIVAYGVNLAILFYAWLIQRRFSNAGLVRNTRNDILFLGETKGKNIALFTTFFTAVILTWMFFPNYWNYAPPRNSADIAQGVTASGHPWIGAENAVLEITEFTDYQCFQCRKMHHFLRQLMIENPGKIKIIHRHFPMDHEFNPIVNTPFHEGSGKLALLAEYAISKNKFWQMNDLLYHIGSQKKPVGTQDLAKKLDLNRNELARAINDRYIRQRVRHDIYSGHKLGITGTPAFLIEGKIYYGHLPEQIIEKSLN